MVLGFAESGRWRQVETSEAPPHPGSLVNVLLKNTHCLDACSIFRVETLTQPRSSYGSEARLGLPQMERGTWA